MQKERYRLYSYIDGAANLFILNLAFVLGWILRFRALYDLSTPNYYRFLQLACNLFWITAALSTKLYEFKLPVLKVGPRIKSIFKAVAVFSLLYFAFIGATKSYVYSRLFHVHFFLILFVLLVLNEVTFAVCTSIVAKKGKFSKNALILGAGALGQLFYEKSKKDSLGYNVVGFLDDDSAKVAHLAGKYLGSISEFEKVVQESRIEASPPNGNGRIDEVIVTCPFEEQHLVSDVISVAQKHYLRVKVIPSYAKVFTTRRPTMDEIDGIPVIGFGDERLSYPHIRVIKRVFDILFSALVLTTVFPILYLVVGIGNKLTSKGPIFFKQLRKGYEGKAFLCYKFRSMEVIDKELEVMQATPDDPRKTKLGNPLRKTNLDEIPQFINVLKGEMSVVGPRPHMVEHDEMYSEIVDQYNVRFLATPGVTGWAQVNGYRGSTDDPELMRKRVEHDIWYIENWSLGLDIKIILMTILRMLKGDPNAY